MSWLRIDDKFAQHPKMLDLSDREFRVHFAALCYCAEYATSGTVPWSSWKMLGVTQKIVDHLVTVGLWKLEDGCYTIHDFKVYNAESLADRVAAYVASYPDATANDVHRAIGGKREVVLHEVAKVKIAGSLGTVREPLLAVPTHAFTPKELKPPKLSRVARDVGHDSHESRVTALADACRANIDDIEKLRRASKGCSEAGFVAALEACKGPGVRDRLAVALSELKKRRAA